MNMNRKPTRRRHEASIILSQDCGARFKNESHVYTQDLDSMKYVVVRRMYLLAILDQNGDASDPTINPHVGILAVFE